MNNTAEELTNPWDDMPEEDWNNLTDDEKRAEILEYNEPPDPLANREANIAKYLHSGEDEEQSYTVQDWFRSYGHEIAQILIDEDFEHADPNLAAAEACIRLADSLNESCARLAEFLMTQKKAV